MTHKNLRIWDQVGKTDPAYTKQYKGAGGFSGTAINAIYMARVATQIFGPIGIGWGYEIIEDRIDKGAPLPMQQGDQLVHAGEYYSIHTIRLKLWYMLDGQRGEVENYGHTPMVYANKYGVQTEQEPAKKSLTDAMKKCLSMLGFSADIFLGEFDDPNYVNQLKTEKDIERAENRDDAIAAKRAELTEYVTRHIATIESAASVNEVNGICKSALRHLSRQSELQDLADIADAGSRKITETGNAKKKELETAE